MATAMMERAPGKISDGLAPRLTRASWYQGRPSIRPLRTRSKATASACSNGSADVTPTRSKPSSRARSWTASLAMASYVSLTDCMS